MSDTFVTMSYEFPTIRDTNDIERYPEVWLSHKSFGRWNRCNGTIVYYYSYTAYNVFPPVGAASFAARARELRSITSDAANGRIVSRPLHKFFNAGECTETLEENFRFGDPRVVLETLDGSMVHTFLAPDGALTFATRNQVTDISRALHEWYDGEDASGAGRRGDRARLPRRLHSRLRMGAVCQRRGCHPAHRAKPDADVDPPPRKRPLRGFL